MRGTREIDFYYAGGFLAVWVAGVVDYGDNCFGILFLLLVGLGAGDWGLSGVGRRAGKQVKEVVRYVISSRS